MRSQEEANMPSDRAELAAEAPTKRGSNKKGKFFLIFHVRISAFYV